MAASRDGQKVILVLEDSSRWCGMLETVFRSRGYVVDIANTPERCLELATTNEPDLIIIDVIMPDNSLGGLECAKQLAEERGTMEIPRLFFTEVGTDVIEDEAAPLSNGVFTKPQDLPRLVEKVADILGT